MYIHFFHGLALWPPTVQRKMLWFQWWCHYLWKQQSLMIPRRRYMVLEIESRLASCRANTLSVPFSPGLMVLFLLFFLIFELQPAVLTTYPWLYTQQSFLAGLGEHLNISTQSTGIVLAQSVQGWLSKIFCFYSSSRVSSRWFGKENGNGKA